MKQKFNIVLASNNNYILGLAATIKSIIYHSNRKDFYQIDVLHSEMSPQNQHLIKSLAKNNVDINFVNINDKLQSISKDILYTSQHISVESYYRLFIPEIYPNLAKVLYLDCDLIVRSDIAQLFNEDIDNYVIGAILNPVNLTVKEYRENVLGVDNNSYFNAGVLLINVQLFLKENIKDKCLNLLVNKIKNPMCHDQDLINAACYSNVKFLNPIWNLQWTPYIFPKSFQATDTLSFKKLAAKSKILHYTTGFKPWTLLNRYSLCWWFYILQTPLRIQSLKILLWLILKQLKEILNTGLYKIKCTVKKILNHMP